MIDIWCLGLPDLFGFQCECHEVGLMALRSLAVVTVEEQGLRSRCCEFGLDIAAAIAAKNISPGMLAEKVYGPSPFGGRLIKRFLAGEPVDPKVAYRVAKALTIPVESFAAPEPAARQLRRAEFRARCTALADAQDKTRRKFDRTRGLLQQLRAMSRRCGSVVSVSALSPRSERGALLMKCSEIRRAREESGPAVYDSWSWRLREQQVKLVELRCHRSAR